MLQEQEIDNLIKKLKRISTLSIILGAIVIFAVIYTRGVLGIISIRMNGSLDAGMWVVTITWGLIALGITLITLGILTRKATVKRARTYSLISILIAWMLFIAIVSISGALGIALDLTITAFILYLIVSHAYLRGVDRLLLKSESEES